MKLNKYIIASLLSHLLLFSILIVFLREMNAEVTHSIFNVDVVGSMEEEKTVPKTIRIPVRPSPPIPRKSIPKDVLKEPPPETMFGEGTSSKPNINLPSDKAGSTGLSQADGFPPTDKKGVLPEGHKGPQLMPKSFLFDKETIEKYAQKRTTKEKDLTFEAPELLHRGYMRMLKDKIESIWKYPEEAARSGISGDLYITFYIHGDGRLGEIKLVRTSGFRELDEAAMKALRDAEPFWPLPEDWEKNELEIKGHFIYILGGGYIM